MPAFLLCCICGATSLLIGLDRRSASLSRPLRARSTGRRQRHRCSVSKSVGMRFLRFREKVKRKASAPTKSIDPVRDESCYDLPSAVPLFLLSLLDNPFVQTQQSAGPDNGACRPHLLYYPTAPYRALFGTAARKEINIRYTALPRTSRQLSERVDRRPIGLATTHFQLNLLDMIREHRRVCKE